MLCILKPLLYGNCNYVKNVYITKKLHTLFTAMSEISSKKRLFEREGKTHVKKFVKKDLLLKA